MLGLPIVLLLISLVFAQEGEVLIPPKVTGLDEASEILAKKKWYVGAKDCELSDATSSPYEVHEIGPGHFVMRQNKCINFEAPFLYLVIGEETAILLDSGATPGKKQMPLRDWVDDMLQKHAKGKELKLIVAHTHSHGDHCAGDGQFTGRPNTTIVGYRPEDVAKAFKIDQWPKVEGSIDLGGRKLSVIPIPGHEESSVAFYDHKSGDLMTGDTIYPGNIFLSKHNWKDFKESIKRLHAFSQKHPVRNILGAHIEMSAEPGKDFPYGSTYHPNEHNLPLRQEHLNELYEYLKDDPKPQYKKFADYILNL